VERPTLLGLVRRLVSQELLVQLVATVGELASSSVGTLAGLRPFLAHLGLVLGLVGHRLPLALHH